VQQILELDERLPFVLDLPVVLGHDVLETGLVGQRLVHLALRAAAALFPYGAQTGRRDAVRVPGQLEPRLLLLLLLLLLDGHRSGGPARSRLSGLLLRFDAGGGGLGVRRPGGAGAGGGGRRAVVA